MEMSKINEQGESMKQFKDIVHEHQLNQEPWDESKKTRCSACDDLLSGESYSCSECEFHLHKRCAEAPFQINHPCHRPHSLFLKPSKERHEHLCDLCKNKISGVFYSCSSCDLDIDRDCLWPRLVIEDESHHEHPFNLLWKQDPFICNACGTEGKSVSYVCVKCHLQVHPSCISLPRFIHFFMHRHPLSHNYFLKNVENEKINCRFCFDEVKTEHGSYSCLKQDCNYILHVNCATHDSDMYEEIDPKEIEDLLKDKPVEPSITVIETNEFGEAIKFKHFLHEHELMIEDKIEEVEDKQCDGCVDLVSSPFYYCSQCNFLLHKSCAEFPRTCHPALVALPFTLKSDGIFKCIFCGHQRSGFSYDFGDSSLCPRCARISNTFKYPGHEDFLVLDEIYGGECTGCGSDKAEFRCKLHDNVALDLKCITRPLAARHKCDKHLLKLAYGDETEDPTQHYCDICEEKRNPRHWLYFCSICNNSAHPDCVLGDYPSIKIGSMYKDKDHEHPLTFVQKIYYYPECAECGEYCLDLSLECATCNYIVHWKCISSVDSD